MFRDMSFQVKLVIRIWLQYNRDYLRSWYLCMNEYIAAKGRTFLSSYAREFWGAGGEGLLLCHLKHGRGCCVELVVLRQWSGYSGYCGWKIWLDQSIVLISRRWCCLLSVTLHQMTVEPMTIGTSCWRRRLASATHLSRVLRVSWSIREYPIGRRWSR